MNRHFTFKGPTLLGILYVSCFIGWALPQTKEVAFRQIVLASEEEAKRVGASLNSGASFEALAAERSQDPTGKLGGYVGHMRLSDLRAEIRQALEGQAPGAVTNPIRVGNAYLLLQVVPEDEARWIELDEAGGKALAEGRSGEAAALFEQALSRAEAAKGGGIRLVKSLDRLASAYRLDGRPVEAEKLYRRALALLEGLGSAELEIAQVLSGLGMALVAENRFAEAQPLYERARSIREKRLGPDAPEVAASLHNLAQVSAGLKRFAQAANLYQQSQSMLEKSLGSDHPAAIAGAEGLQAFRRSLMPELLERFSTLVSLSEFKDRSFSQTVAEIRELLPLAPLSEHSYVQMKDILLEVGLTEETEQILRAGLEKIPGSRILRIYLADLMAGTGRTQSALVILQETTRLPRPGGLDAAADRQQQAIIYERIGDLQAALTNFDDAVASYRQALEIDPATPTGHLKLGKAYFSNGRLEEAQAEFSRAILDMPDGAAAHLNLSETHLAAAHWEQAATAAERAITLGATDSRALYLLGTSLVRMGRLEDGQKRLQEFAQVESEFRDAEHRNREIEAASTAAIRASREGNGDGAIKQLAESIAKHPDSARLLMDLAMVQSRQDKHRDAVKTLESMLDRGIGRGFLIHKSLAEEYALLGNAETSRHHRQIYLDTREAELIVYAPE